MRACLGSFMLFKISYRDPLHKRTIKLTVCRWIDGFEKVTDGIRKEGVSAFYKHLAEDVPMQYVAETEFQLQEMGGTERAEAHRGV